MLVDLVTGGFAFELDAATDPEAVVQFAAHPEVDFGVLSRGEVADRRAAPGSKIRINVGIPNRIVAAQLHVERLGLRQGRTRRKGDRSQGSCSVKILLHEITLP